MITLNNLQKMSKYKVLEGFKKLWGEDKIKSMKKEMGLTNKELNAVLAKYVTDGEL